ncbi:transcription factor bHLH94-like [Wolffia australiana]
MSFGVALRRSHSRENVPNKRIQKADQSETEIEKDRESERARHCRPGMTLEALTSSFFVYDTISYGESSHGAFYAVDNGECLEPTFVPAIDAGSPVENPNAPSSSGAIQSRKKRRRRPRSCKNKEEAESQRMTHIAVERNRRRQMNEHLAVLRSLMPESYIQRGDQASIVAGAIDFVKELEQLLQSLEAQKLTLQRQQEGDDSEQAPFSQFFAYPQYVWCQGPRERSSSPAPPPAPAEAHRPPVGSVADIEVTLIETFANLRILSPRRPGQLLKMVAGLQSLLLTVLHLSVTSMESLVLYSVSAKVEEGCNLTSVDDIAAAVHHMLSLIEAEAALA